MKHRINHLKGNQREDGGWPENTASDDELKGTQREDGGWPENTASDSQREEGGRPENTASDNQLKGSQIYRRWELARKPKIRYCAKNISICRLQLLHVILVIMYTKETWLF